jgi:hypothetical protein
MLVSPDEFGIKRAEELGYVNSVRLLSDHTWEIILNDKTFFI